MRAIIAAIERAICLRHDLDRTEERAVYAEIGRIVGIPFSVANVYERFAGQVAKIIPFELIVIALLDREREQIKLMYGIGLEAMGLAEGDTISLNDSVVAEVAAAKKAIRTDGHRYYGSLGRSLGASGLVSRIATPLIANNDVVGTLHLASSIPGAYGAIELAGLETVGNQIAGAIASTILLQAEKERPRQLESLYSVAAVAAQPLGFEEKAQKIVDALALIAEAEHVAPRRFDEEQDVLELIASAGLEPGKFSQSLKMTGTNLATRESFATGEPINIGEYGTHPNAHPNLLARGVESLYFVPIVSEGRPLGSISVASNHANYFDDGQIALIRPYSNEIFSLLNSVDQAEKLQRTQETALENERRNTRMHDGLFRISRIFAETGDLSSKAKAALEIALNLAGADWATLRIVKDSEPGFHLAAAAGLAATASPPIPTVAEARITLDKAFTEGKLTVIDDYPAWPGASEKMIEMGMQSLVFLPLKINERIMGVASVVSKKKDCFDQELVNLLTSVVDGLGNLLEFSILQDQSEIAHMELERLSEELSRANKVLEDTMVTRTHELEEARELAAKGEKMAVIGQLSAGMAHDLRNPLGAIRNATYMLKRELVANGAMDSSPRLRKWVEIVEKQVTKSNESITDLMDFAKLKEAALVETQLGEVIAQTMETLTCRPEITVSQDIDPNLRPVMADGELLQRVFLNLANNAQEAMLDGGCLGIAARNNPDDVEITFSDTGEGISEEILDKIFDPLFTTKVKGTGLGLAVCLEIIERHGGTISARRNDAPSGGTSFDVRIPVFSS